jgi:bacteriocin biosynthesis cyclodehydratase domain-containing protein
MSSFSLQKPRLPSHYYLRFEPPDSSGDEVLVITSERRRLKLKGQLFREFLQCVVPLLDGTRTLPQIQAEVAEVFTADDLERSLRLLAEQHVLEDAAQDGMSEAARAELAPQLHFLHEAGLNAQAVQAQLARSTVAVFGLGPLGASVAFALAAARVGTIRCVDPLPIAASDRSLAPALAGVAVGTPRVDAVSRQIAVLANEVRVETDASPLQTDDDVAQLIAGADHVVCCVDPGLASVFYRLNRACLQARQSWTAAAVSGLEGVIGPTIVPFETACYLCYTMRSVACAYSPEDEFTHRQFLDRRQRDDSPVRENHVFGVGAVANLVGLEVLKALSGLIQPATRGRIVSLDFLSLESTTHLVLRKPWCPACFAAPPAGTS